MKAFVFFLAFLSLRVSADPKQLEVWFLSPLSQKVSWSVPLVKKPLLLALNTRTDRVCQKVGEYCFDPQVGLYKEESIKEEEVEAVDTENVIEHEKERQLLKGTETELVECERGLYFDIFCGKVNQAKGAKAELEVWLDISSSLRHIDGYSKGNSCYRKSFAKRLKNKCDQNVSFQVFNTSLKSMDEMDSLCLNIGLNNQDRLMSWIELSEAKHLIVITDIHEYSREFADFLEQRNAIIRGENIKGPLTAEDLLELVPKLAKSCIKK